MAEHKVPQDVEADDKLIGPFSFRQFIYLMIAFGGCVAAFFLGQAAIPLALVPAPVIILFAALALPLKKDQPMEVYLAALVKYYLLKPKTRIWVADGEESNVQISAPTIDDMPKTKELAGDEVSRRLSFLANITDTQGWATRGLSTPVNQTNLNDDFANAAAEAYDIMDESNTTQMDNMLDRSDRQMKAQAVARMNQTAARPNNLGAAPLPTYSYQAPVATPPPTMPPVANPDNDTSAITEDLIRKVVTHKVGSNLAVDRNVRVINPTIFYTANPTTPTAAPAPVAQTPAATAVPVSATAPVTQPYAQQPQPAAQQMMSSPQPMSYPYPSPAQSMTPSQTMSVMPNAPGSGIMNQVNNQQPSGVLSNYMNTNMGPR